MAERNTSKLAFEILGDVQKMNLGPTDTLVVNCKIPMSPNDRQRVSETFKKVFPNNPLVELPANHPIFNQKFKFNGLPKIHEHDGKRPQAFGIIDNGRLICLYTYETDLSDGWEDAQVHNDPADKRKQALQMGANILMYAFMK
jgi:hypothetical protein